MNTKQIFEIIDRNIIAVARSITLPFARISIFLVYFWFGILKVVNASPAGPLVESLLEQTLPFISPEQFFICFGLYEMLIGILFLIPNKERIAIAFLIPHLIMTALPLLLLPHMTWYGAFIPTMEGQYIVKNILIASLAMSIGAHLKPGKFFS